jgi:S-adenosylmethionine:tRNA ribosyltransferase-isomerase
LAVGDAIEFSDGLAAQVAAKGDRGEVELVFNCAGDALRAAIERVGMPPLPPYISRPPDARDRADYQTIFATHAGAVAAPTAGLHFTPELVAAMERRGVAREFVTLHVGAGTFLPVRAEEVESHVMHAERGVLTAATADRLNQVRAAGGRIVAVGTTSLRLMESAVGDDGSIAPFDGATRLFITPGYRFRTADILMTNFHLPRSTLFMLVAAFAGLAPMRRAYAHAVARRYRFFSYGDACLIERAG